MNWLEITAILIIGFVGSAEFSSATLVHPVIRKLSPNDQLTFEQGLLQTFGRIMPIGMTASAILAITIAVETPTVPLIAAATALSIALVVTIIGNVPINLRTGRIKQNTAPEGFIAMRRKWDIFQFIRGSLQLIGFILISIGLVGL